MPKMREDDLKALLASEKSDALSAMQATKLSEERERAMRYYNGDVSSDMPTVTDRSKAVSYDVSDTVEGLMPALMDIFFGGDEVVKFTAVNEEDEPQAEQETAYINHVFMQQQQPSGFIVGYSWLKDALILKNGVVKIYWEECEDEERETFLDQPSDVYALFLAEQEAGEIKIVEHTEHEPEPYAPTPAEIGAPPEQPLNMPDQLGMMGPAGSPDTMQGGAPNMMSMDDAGAMQAGMAAPAPDVGNMPTHDITIVKTRKYGRCRVVGVPPEEFGVGRIAKIGEKLKYSYHEVRRTQSDLIDEGYDEEQVKKLPTAVPDSSAETIARDTVDESQQSAKNEINKANRLILITEHYVMMDYEENGKARLYKVTTGGDGDGIAVMRRGKEIDVEQVDFDPFASITPFIVTHRFFGRSVADLVIDIQRIKTSLTRGMLDNIYQANNQRLEVAESFAHPKTLDDILDNRIGGVVRTKTPGGLIPIPNSPIGDFVFPMVEYQDQVREWRTGVSRHGQGLNSDALQDIGDDARDQMMDAVQQKTKLIARIFAETGFKDLMWKIHATVRKHESSKPTARLRGKWVTVDPREWKRRDDLTATVGLGDGSKAQQISFLGNEISTMQESLRIVPGLTTPAKLHYALTKRLALAGYRDGDQFWSNPEEEPPAEPPKDPKQIEVEGKLQLAEQKQETDTQISAAKLQADQQAQAAKIQGDMMIAREKAKLEREKMIAEFNLKHEQMVAEFQLRERQMEEELDMQREEIHLNAAVQDRANSQKVRLGGKPG